jgi:hypothetical protein
MSKKNDEISADAYDARFYEQKKIREAKESLQALDNQMTSFKGVLGMPKKERPIITQKMLDKAKKKLKKLQKRQRKQDNQGVTQKFSIEPPVMPKITEEMMDAIRSLYHIVPRDVALGDIKEANAHDCLVKANKALDDVINAPVVTESLDVSERPIVCGDGLKPRIIDTKTIEEFIKFRDKMARLS